MLYRLATPGLSINTYLVVDPLTHKGAVIDPVRDTTALLQKIQETKAEIIAILETHVHADFISGSKELKHQLKGAPTIYCSGLGGKEWIPSYADSVIKDREEIKLGSLRLQAWHTPGHTLEHIMWLIFDDQKSPSTALTGDFLFVGSLGRPDLLGHANFQDLSSKLFHSVFDLLPQLPDTLEILPAHGAGSLCGKNIGPRPSSTLGWERQNNPFLKPKPEKEWIENLMENMPPVPDYFTLMKELNVGGSNLLEELQLKEITPHEFSQVDRKEIFLMDIRSKEEFAKQHLPGSLNIPFAPPFVNWAPIVIPYNKEIVLVANDRHQIDPAVKALRLVGLDASISTLILNEEAQTFFQKESASFPLISPEDLMDLKQNKGDILQIIDVRTDPEWHAGHIEGAKHILLNNLQANIPHLSKNREFALICGSGYRASIGASMLQQAGYKHVYNIQGGMQAWVNAKLPMVKS